MPVYTVHEPPLRAAEASPSVDRFIFMRDGFSFWAFLVAPWWMLWHRMWLVLLAYVVITVGVVWLLVVLGAAPAALLVVGILISLLVGLEASTLRRFALRRRGWRNVGIVSGDDLEDAEWRFFTAWVNERAKRHHAVGPSVTAPPPAAPAPPPPAAEVVGLFPEPGAQP